jgi:hypothetical protein
MSCFDYLELARSSLKDAEADRVTSELESGTADRAVASDAGAIREHRRSECEPGGARSQAAACTGLAAAVVRSNNVTHRIASLDSTDRRSEVTDMRENMSAAVVGRDETKSSR